MARKINILLSLYLSVYDYKEMIKKSIKGEYKINFEVHSFASNKDIIRPDTQNNFSEGNNFDLCYTLELDPVKKTVEIKKDGKKLLGLELIFLEDVLHGKEVKKQLGSEEAYTFIIDYIESIEKKENRIQGLLTIEGKLKLESNPRENMVQLYANSANGCFY